MKIAIHQPNFFPYYPFFQKMQEVDIFVILTNCQFEKNGFQNRFKYNDRWFTMKVNKGLKPIEDKIYVDYKKDWKLIKNNFKNIEIFDDCISSSLPKTNIEIIKIIKDKLNIKCEIVFDYKTELKSSHRLVDICKKYNAKKYLSGLSGKKYLDINLFGDIKVLFQDESKMIKKPILDII